MEHKMSVKEYLPKIRHHCRVAERHERAVLYVKSKKKRQRHINIARKHRRRCTDLAKIWGQQCAWNREHWNYVFDKMYGPITPRDTKEVEETLRKWMWKKCVEDNATKARSYDFWGNSDLLIPPKPYVDPIDEIMSAFRWEDTDDWEQEEWDAAWDKMESNECLSNKSNESLTLDNPESSSSQETSTTCSDSQATTCPS